MVLDVLVVGGGPAGLAFAVRLHRAGAQVLVVERSTWDEPRVGETVPGRLIPLLSAAGLDEAFSPEMHSPAPALVSHWGSGAPAARDAIFDPYGDGWHLDRLRFDRALAAAAARAGVEILRGTRVLSCVRRNDRRWDVELREGERTLHAEATIVADATGRSASIARLCGAVKQQTDRLVALVATGGGASDDPATLVEACPDGWWYAASLPARRAAFVWTSDADLIARDAPDRAWREALASSTAARERAGGFAPDEVRLVSAATHRLDRFAGANWLAIGDAAFAFDPLSGQGVCKAIESALRAAQSVIGGSTAGYESWCSAQFDGYVQQKRAYYALEDRWPERPFWARRARPINA